MIKISAKIKRHQLREKAHASYQRQARGFAARMLQAGYFIQRESMRLVPVQTGVLRASANTRAEGEGMDRVVTVGYSTNYALYVHENLENAHGGEFNRKHADRIAAAPAGDKYWFNRGPDQQAKFLEQPFRENRHYIRQIIRGR